MSDLVLKNASVCCADFHFHPVDVRICGPQITEISADLECPDVIDLSDLFLLPGLVDIHIHGRAGADTCDASLESLQTISRSLAEIGVTSFCPTTMTLVQSDLARCLEVIRTAASQVTGAAIRGINLEGPYLSPNRKGAHKAEFLRYPDFEEFSLLYRASGEMIRLVDIAPELPGSTEFIRQAKQFCTVSIAHTDADYHQACEAFACGISHATHLFNAMSGLSHRAPGVVGAILDTPSVSAELICDGFHIHPAVQRSTFRLLGNHRAVIVSDSMRAAGYPDGNYDLGGQLVAVEQGQARLSDGTIAGSTTNLLQEIQNLLEYGLPLEQVLRSATINPARQIGQDHDIGSLETGKLADLVAVTSSWEPVFVMREGNVLVNKLP